VRRYGRAVLGGTFDHLHLGHEVLLATAFRVGRAVSIGITSERYLADHPKPDGAPIQPYAVRRRHLVTWLRHHEPGRSWTLVPIDDRFGGSTGPGVGVLVVSADTLGGGRAVNAERRRLGRPSVPIVAVPLALADDLSPIASRRIRSGLIDRRGRRTAPIRIDVRTSTPMDAPPVRRAVRAAFPRAVLVAPSFATRSRAPSDRTSSGRRRGPPELTVEVDRAPGRGWTVRERSTYVTLRPVRIAATDPTTLERALRDLLRPSSRSGPTESF
jgi:pantetheine-phosphate adenylyltransferase